MGCQYSLKLLRLSSYTLRITCLSSITPILALNGLLCKGHHVRRGRGGGIRAVYRLTAPQICVFLLTAVPMPCGTSFRMLCCTQSSTTSLPSIASTAMYLSRVHRPGNASILEKPCNPKQNRRSPESQSKSVSSAAQEESGWTRLRAQNRRTKVSQLNFCFQLQGGAVAAIRSLKSGTPKPISTDRSRKASCPRCCNNQVKAHMDTSQCNANNRG